MARRPRGLFEGDAPRVRASPPSADFLRVVADRLCTELQDEADPFALADATVLLPNRRAARALTEAFAARGEARLLPSIRPLGDVEDDSDVWGADPIAFAIPPAIDPLRRRLELASLLRARERSAGGGGDPAGAIAAADELVKLLDAAASTLDGVDWSRLPHLIEDRELARHWAASAEFLQIIAAYWPQRLAAEGLVDPGARRTALHLALARSWEKAPPKGHIVIAGSTGSIASVRELMKVVSRLARGCVVLPGLDGDLDDAAWAEVDESHPQHGLKITLAALGVARDAVPALAGAGETRPARARRALVREALIPADRTADWLARLDEAAAPWGGAQAFAAEACAGLRLIEARNEEEEASAIALLLREAIETPGRDAALVTPDARLAQRVAAKLARWGVEAHPSAGGALEETPVGVLLALLGDLAADEGEPVALAALLKHPLSRLWESEADIAALERAMLRGPRVHGDLADLHARATANACPPGVLALAARMRDALAPLREAFAAGEAETGDLAEALVLAAEHVAGGEAWAGAAGEAANTFLHALADTKSEGQDALGAVARHEAPRLIAALLFGRAASPERDSDPRIAIWGPLEARLQQRDLVVLGGLNEGVWPQAAPDDPFLSRGLRAALGLPQTEARIGLAAHDFAQLANAREVALTRAVRAGGAPTIASRWVWRLDTLARAAGRDLRAGAQEVLAWARALDRPERAAPIRAPRPKPAASGARIDRLSITDVEKLIRDPYAIYAKRILRLEKLRPVGAQADGSDLGSAIHKALEMFAPAGGTVETLLARIDAELAARGFPAPQRAAAQARLAAAAREFVAWNAERAAMRAFLEAEAQMAVRGVRLRGIADRIEIAPAGAEITDFKTGQLPSDRQINAQLAPQLLIEAAMLAEGAFAAAPRLDTHRLIYWRFAGTSIGEKICKLDQPVAQAAAQALAGLEALLAHYEKPDAAFLSKPRVEFISDIDDYDHLARRKEWAEAEAADE
ncbi:MAG: double-strand break repair protein AddB [Hyphomonadaceae bacterium]